MTTHIEIRPMHDGEKALWGAMRQKLWPECGDADNEEDMAALADPACALRVVFLAFDGSEAVGFAEVSERSVVDGAGNAPAAHVEGLWVDANHRRRSVASGLIRAAADWARVEGFRFLGSDVELHNTVSQAAHEAMGFVEQGRVVNYLLDIDK